MKSSILVVIGIALLASGCVSSRAQQIRNLPREQVAEAAKAVSITPSPVTTVEFKELGESAQFRTMGQIVERTWRSQCQVTGVRLFAYTPRGDSMWRVRCAGSAQLLDYHVALPERRATGARVLKCTQSGARTVRCSIFAESPIT